MTTDRSSKAYIARVQSQNVIASVENRVRGGIGFLIILPLAKILSVINAPPQIDTSANILPPTNLSASVVNNGNVTLTWVNNATGIIDTLVEINTGLNWDILTHDPLGAATSIQITFFQTGYFRVSSVTAGGISVPSEPILFQSTLA